MASISLQEFLGGSTIISDSSIKDDEEEKKRKKAELEKLLKEESKEEDFISISNLEAGDIVFFNSKLVHKSGNLSCNDIRWTAQFRYNDLLESNFIERGYPHPYVYKPVALDY